MTVIQAIASLLYDHVTLIVPGLGAFVRHDESAQVNVVTNEFQRPTSTLDFDPTQREENRVVIEFLMQHDHVTEEEARQRIASFVAECYAKMREEGEAALEGIGVLRLGNTQELVFEPSPDVDFNPDAFGLENLEVPPVFDSGVGKSDIVPEPTDTTPEPIDESADNTPHRNLWWLWVLLALVLAGVALWYFQFRPVPTKPVPPTPPVTVDTVKERPIITVADSVVEPFVDSVTEPVVDSVIQPIEEPVVEPDPTVEVVKPQPESRAFIVGGCFSVEQNALNMVAEVIGKGCSDAFVMKRGSMFYVCYGQYPSTADAKAALPAIWDNYNSKAWILTK